MNVKVGCCGFRNSRKTYYKNFDTVEVQMTFYRIFEHDMFKKWKKEAPEGFVFNIKAFQGVTHPTHFNTWRRYGIRPKGDYGYLRDSKEVFLSWQQTLEVADMFNSEIILIQLPASFRPTKENIANAEKFFSTIDRKSYKLVVELRGWDLENIYKLCKNYELTDVVDILRRPPVYCANDLLYIRLHGTYTQRNKIFYQYDYTLEELEKVWEEVERFNMKEVRIYFNNSYMFKNAKEFKQLR